MPDLVTAASSRETSRVLGPINLGHQDAGLQSFCRTKRALAGDSVSGLEPAELFLTAGKMSVGGWATFLVTLLSTGVLLAVQDELEPVLA